LQRRDGCTSDNLEEDGEDLLDPRNWKNRDCAVWEENEASVAFLVCKREDGIVPLELDSLPDLWVAFRVYLEPGNGVGPAFAEILYDRVIVFAPKE